MRRWQKRVLWSVAALALTLVAVMVTLQFVIDDARLKSIAQQKVQKTWGRQLELETLTWNIFPYPNVSAGGVSVSNADWAQDRQLFEIESVSARLALLPLLTGNAVIKRLDFKGLKVNLEVGADGRRNWDLPHVGSSDSAAQRPAQTLKQVDLTALRIQNGTVNYRVAKQPAVEWKVSNLQADGDDGLRNVAFNIDVERAGHPLQVSGKLADLSQFGAADAASKGSIDIRSGQAAIALKGILPLTLNPQRFQMSVAVDAPTMKDAFGFFDIKRGLPAPLKTSATVQRADGVIEVKNFKLQLGKLNAAGEGRWNDSGKMPVFNARLQADHIDLVQTFLDAGQPPLPPKREGELFRDKPLPWRLLTALDGTQGKLDLRVGLLKLRSGVDVSDAAANATFDNDTMTVPAFSGKLLGGSAAGDAVFKSAGRSVQLNIQLKGTQLGQWFDATGKKVDMTGGPMQVDAHISTAGDSMKALAAAVTGPVNIRVGPATIRSPKAGKAEFWLTGLFSAKNEDQINLSCVAMRLPFQAGIAKGEGIAGARSDASQLLTGGTIDMRQQALDLRGRVRARSGVSLGISTFAGDVKIGGKIIKPQLNLDEAGLGGAIARIGAAILTSGISIVATSIWDGANPESDPCQVVFSDKAKAAQGPSKRESVQ